MGIWIFEREVLYLINNLVPLKRICGWENLPFLLIQSVNFIIIVLSLYIGVWTLRTFTVLTTTYNPTFWNWSYRVVFNNLTINWHCPCNAYKYKGLFSDLILLHNGSNAQFPNPSGGAWRHRKLSFVSMERCT